MPLHANHIRHIHAIIDHLLEFDNSTPNNFLCAIQEFQQALQTVSSDTNNPYHQLARCLFSPSKTLLKLEKCTPPASETNSSIDELRVIDDIKALATELNKPLTSLPSLSTAEVQLYLASYIENHIIRLANELQIPEIEIDIYTHFRELAKSHIEQPFQSQPFSMTVEHPELVLEDHTHLIYSAQLSIEEHDLATQSYRATINVTVAVGENPQHIAETIDTYSELSFDTDRERNNYLDQLRKDASEIARLSATIIAIEYLDSCSIPVNIKIEESDKNMRRLLCTKRYWQAILDKKLSITELCQHDDETTEKLLTPSIADLVTTLVLPIDRVRELQPHHINFLHEPHIHHLVKNGNISPETILSISVKRGKFLTHPVISHLIKIKKLPLTDALLLPTFLTHLGDNHTFTLFPITHPLLQTPSQVGLLAMEHTRDYFLQENVDWRLVAQLSRRQSILLFQPSFFSLLVEDVVPLKKFVKFSDHAIRLLETLPSACTYLRNDLLKLEELQQCLSEKMANKIIAQLFASRLFWIVENDVLLENDTTDAVIDDLLELEKCGLYHDDKFTDLIEKIADLLLAFITNQLQTYAKKADTRDEKFQLNYLYQYIISLSNNKQIEKLELLIDHADYILRNPNLTKQSDFQDNTELERPAKRRKKSEKIALGTKTEEICLGLTKISILIELNALNKIHSQQKSLSL